MFTLAVIVAAVFESRASDVSALWTLRVQSSRRVSNDRSAMPRRIAAESSCLSKARDALTTGCGAQWQRWVSASPQRRSERASSEGGMSVLRRVGFWLELCN